MRGHVDVDAVRNLPDEVIGLAGLVRQTWERYRIPAPITECHLGSSPPVRLNRHFAGLGGTQKAPFAEALGVVL